MVSCIIDKNTLIVIEAISLQYNTIQFSSWDNKTTLELVFEFNADGQEERAVAHHLCCLGV